MGPAALSSRCRLRNPVGPAKIPSWPTERGQKLAAMQGKRAVWPCEGPMTEMRGLAPPAHGPSAHAGTRGATAARKRVTRFLRKAVQNAGFRQPCHGDKYSRHSSAG